MALKYYNEEKVKFPWHEGYSLGRDDIKALVDAACDNFGLQRCDVRFDIGPGGKWVASFHFHWAFRTRYFRFSSVNTVRTVLHEVAHYLDWHERCKEIAMVQSVSTSNSALMPIINKIKKAHFHGPRHRTAMAKLVAWFDKAYPADVNGRVYVTPKALPVVTIEQHPLAAVP
jgi:hypothetical protein